MKLCQVLGSVTLTERHPSLYGRALLCVQPVDGSGRAQGASFVALDDAQAGPGDVVLVLREGGSIRKILADEQAPVRSLIVGVVDRVEVGQ